MYRLYFCNCKRKQPNFDLPEFIFNLFIRHITTFNYIFDALEKKVPSVVACDVHLVYRHLTTINRSLQILATHRSSSGQ